MSQTLHGTYSLWKLFVILIWKWSTARHLLVFLLKVAPPQAVSVSPLKWHRLWRLTTQKCRLTQCWALKILTIKSVLKINNYHASMTCLWCKKSMGREQVGEKLRKWAWSAASVLPKALFLHRCWAAYSCSLQLFFRSPVQLNWMNRFFSSIFILKGNLRTKSAGSIAGELSKQALLKLNFTMV